MRKPFRRLVVESISNWCFSSIDFSEVKSLQSLLIVKPDKFTELKKLNFVPAGQAWEVHKTNKSESLCLPVSV